MTEYQESTWPSGIFAILEKLRLFPIVDRSTTTMGPQFPIPRRWALTPRSCETLGLASDHGETLLTATELGSSIGSGGTVVSDVVVAVHVATSETLDAIPRSQGVSIVLSHSFNHHKDPLGAFRLATSTAAGARV